jgi:hypothetical protein
MRLYDHFHAGIILKDGTLVEVEGGWTGFPAKWEDTTQKVKDAYLLSTACSWADIKPDQAQELKYFRLAG